jgi:hypothetical protein
VLNSRCRLRHALTGLSGAEPGTERVADIGQYMERSAQLAQCRLARREPIDGVKSVIVPRSRESTITKVIGLLRERGVVVGVAGRGTFVAER